MLRHTWICSSKAEREGSNPSMAAVNPPPRRMQVRILPDPLSGFWDGTAASSIHMKVAGAEAPHAGAANPHKRLVWSNNK